jgi:hypothetical protein
MKIVTIRFFFCLVHLVLMQGCLSLLFRPGKEDFKLHTQLRNCSGDNVTVRFDDSQIAMSADKEVWFSVDRNQGQIFDLRFSVLAGEGMVTHYSTNVWNNYYSYALNSTSRLDRVIRISIGDGISLVDFGSNAPRIMVTPANK